MRAILVCVDFADLLSITLPYNRHHFERVMVVTSHADGPNVLPVALANSAEVLCTDLFYADGATFNKWRALEWALDLYGREGWLCLIDADVLWPKSVKVAEEGDRWLAVEAPTERGLEMQVVPRGHLCSPLRRMWSEWPRLPPGFLTTNVVGGSLVLEEQHWSKLPIHRNVAEWAGYTQIFHASDPHLGQPPWHETDWRHAGGADSFFQAKWPAQNKVRPPFEVLHLGEAGVNWMGRVTGYADGTLHPHGQVRRQRVLAMWRERRRRERTGEARFGPEKLGG